VKDPETDAERAEFDELLLTVLKALADNAGCVLIADDDGDYIITITEPES
jgi:hypothetical protein